MNIFEKATRINLTFNVNGSGQLSIWQLWGLNHSKLANYEQELSETVESYTKSTRRVKAARTKEQADNELRLAIVTHILDVREAEMEKSVLKASLDIEEQKLLAEQAERNSNSVKKLTDEELQARLAEIRAAKA